MRRREFLTELVSLSVVFAAVGCSPAKNLTPILKPTLVETPQRTNEFDGSVEQTQRYLQEWNARVGRDFNKLKEHLPQMINLSTAYFSKQMSEMFPDRARDYEKSKFASKINIVDEQTLEKEDSIGACAPSTPNNPNFVAFGDAFRDLIFFSPQRLEKISQASKTEGDLIKNTFVVLIHELAHFSAKKIEHNPAIRVFGIPEPVSYQKGLSAFSRRNNQGKECYVARWNELEETVVEDAITRLAEKVGVQNKISVYGRWVNSYRTRTLPLVEGDFRLLFGYQQTSDRDSLLRTIGKKMGQQDPQGQLETGIIHATSLYR